MYEKDKKWTETKPEASNAYFEKLIKYINERGGLIALFKEQTRINPARAVALTKIKD